ncbi:hypothetical protein L3X38_032479 [Prunus dulcis]|uniref:Uncharacterized protein n=1 Tax=Prunus dulcis TaxID=3755 RepID=A0AAD4YUZ6_PRUDU|nr:hypothetical protein L3X38_032479 [Prunus dulcis]
MPCLSRHREVFDGLIIFEYEELSYSFSINDFWICCVPCTCARTQQVSLDKTRTSQDVTEPLSQRSNKVEDVADEAAKSISFSFEDHDDVARIGKMWYDALIMESKCLKIRLRWYEETLGKEKKKAKFHLRSVQIMKVRVRLAKGKGVRRFNTSNKSV